MYLELEIFYTIFILSLYFGLFFSSNVKLFSKRFFILGGILTVLFDVVLFLSVIFPFLLSNPSRAFFYNPVLHLILVMTFTECLVIMYFFSLYYFEAINIDPNSIGKQLKEGTSELVSLITILLFGVIILVSFVGYYHILNLTSVMSMMITGDLFCIALIIYRLSFFLFLIQGIFNGYTLRQKQKSFGYYIQVLLIIISIIVAILDLFDLSIKWPFLYIGNLYFGFFFLSQLLNMIISLKYVPSGYRKSVFVTILQLVLILIIIENIELYTTFSVFFFKIIKILYLLGFLIPIRYKSFQSIKF